ncbi:MAG: ABC transporter substrate-binding protein [Pseudomonadota bacterium]
MPLARLVLPLVLLVAGCGGEQLPPPEASAQRPMRIVSLDLCADQYVLKLVDRERILAVSPVATEDFSYMRDAARGLPKVRPVAEDVLVLKPDLVVRAYGGGPNAAAFFERAGVPVLNVSWASDIPGVFDIIESLAAGMGEPARGAQVVTNMRARLERVASSARERAALYMTPSGVTTGPGSLVHEMLVAAGLQNFQAQAGWQPIPLERLAYESPDLVAAAFFDTHTNHPDAWSPMRHPVARDQLRDRETVMLKGAWTACSGWFLMDAVEALAAGSGL